MLWYRLSFGDAGTSDISTNSPPVDSASTFADTDTPPSDPSENSSKYCFRGSLFLTSCSSYHRLYFGRDWCGYHCCCLAIAFGGQPCEPHDCVDRAKWSWPHMVRPWLRLMRFLRNEHLVDRYIEVTLQGLSIDTTWRPNRLVLDSRHGSLACSSLSVPVIPIWYGRLAVYHSNGLTGIIALTEPPTVADVTNNDSHWQFAVVVAVRHLSMFRSEFGQYQNVRLRVI